MARAKIDELNILSEDTQENSSNDPNIFDYHDFILHYFDPMQITEAQKNKRIEAAEEIFDAVLLFLMWCENAPERVQEENTQRSFENMYKEVIFQYSEPDDYFDMYVPLFIANLVQTTLDHQGEEYFYSVERAANVACNESNTVIQYSELKEAVNQGYNVKIWQTQLDDRVRDSHIILEGMKKGILEYFPVGDSLLLFPRDEKNCSNLADIAGCRCSLRFDVDSSHESYTTEDLLEEVESEEQKQKNSNSIEALKVDWETLTDDELRRKISLLGEDSRTSRMIFDSIKETLEHRSGTHFEDLSYISKNKKKWEINKTYDFYDEEKHKSACKPNKAMKKMLREEPKFSVIGLHNHPESSVPSLPDIYLSKKRNYAYGLVIGHDGTIFKYKTNDYFDLDKIDDNLAKNKEFLINSQLDKLNRSLHNNDTEKLVSAMSSLINMGVDIEVFR